MLETFAHYLHIRDTLDTSAAFGFTASGATFERRMLGPSAGTGADADTDTVAAGTDTDETAPDTGDDSEGDSESKDLEVYVDSAYADGATLDEQTARGHDMRAKVPPVRNANGFSKDQFSIDLAAGTVTCPARHTVTARATATAWPASVRCVVPAHCARTAPKPAGAGDQHPSP
jgi:hypothetical protein